MVGGIEAGPLEHDPDRRDDLLQGFLAALGAGLERLVMIRLLALELHSTVLTAIGINGHSLRTPS